MPTLRGRPNGGRRRVPRLARLPAPFAALTAIAADAGGAGVQCTRAGVQRITMNASYRIEEDPCGAISRRLRTALALYDSGVANQRIRTATPAAVPAPRARSSAPPPRPERAHCSISTIPNTRLKGRAQFMRTSWEVGASTAARCLAPIPPSDGRDQRAQRRVRREHAMKPRHMHPRRRHQRRQPRDDVQRFQHDVRHPVTVRGLQSVRDVTLRRHFAESSR